MSRIANACSNQRPLVINYYYYIHILIVKCVLKILFRIDGVFIDHLGIVMNVKRLQRRLPLFFTRHWGGVESLNWDKYDIGVSWDRFLLIDRLIEEREIDRWSNVGYELSIMSRKKSFDRILSSKVSNK